MKYMERGGFQGHPMMRLTLRWTLAFMVGLWCTNAAMYFTRMGLTPASVQAYYLGSAEEFSSPRSAASLLETTHAHLPVMGMVLLLLTHLLIFAPGTERFKKNMITGVFLSALLGEASGWLIRFGSPGFAWLKIVSFAVFQLGLGALIAMLAAFLGGGALQSHALKPKRPS